MSILICGSIAYDNVMVFPGRFKEHILPDKIVLPSAAIVLAIGCERSRAEPRVLVFGSPQAATPEMVSALAEAAAEEEVELRMTTDPTVVTEDSLARYRGFILLNSSGDLLDRRQQADLERFVEAGGAFLDLGGLPARTWPWLTEQGEGGRDGVIRLTEGGQAANYADAAFRQRLGEAFATLAQGGPRYSGLDTGRVPDSTRFEQQILIPGPLDEPTEMAIATDGRVFFTERRGALKLFEPTTGEVRVVHQFELFTEDENGLIGIALEKLIDKHKSLIDGDIFPDPINLPLFMDVSQRFNLLMPCLI